jgi:hypothetical protein
MRFLVFAHVDGDEILLAAIQRFGQRQRGFGLADAGSPGQQEYADRLAGLSSPAREVWMRLAIISIAWSWPITRWPSVDPICRMVSISFFAMRPTGMPVQSPTTAATAW